MKKRELKSIKKNLGKIFKVLRKSTKRDLGKRRIKLHKILKRVAKNTGYQMQKSNWTTENMWKC